MNSFSVICASLIVISAINGQTIHYLTRFRNLTIESETGDIYLVDMKIFRDKYEHKISGMVNVTKDFYIKRIEIILNRCSFEKSACENFQHWKFTQGLKSLIYMKNQMWTPIVENITPEFNLPFVKKNIYRTHEVNANAKAIMIWYPEAINYYWQTEGIAFDRNNKKAIVLKMEFAFASFTERNRKRGRGSRPNNKK